jgi:hypothetical protein
MGDGGCRPTHSFAEPPQPSPFEARFPRAPQSDGIDAGELLDGELLGPAAGFFAWAAAGFRLAVCGSARFLFSICRRPASRRQEGCGAEFGQRVRDVRTAADAATDLLGPAAGDAARAAVRPDDAADASTRSAGYARDTPGAGDGWRAGLLPGRRSRNAPGISRPRAGAVGIGRRAIVGNAAIYCGADHTAVPKHHWHAWRRRRSDWSAVHPATLWRLAP